METSTGKPIIPVGRAAAALLMVRFRKELQPILENRKTPAEAKHAA